jgi:endo-1,4-beta-xylanase
VTDADRAQHPKDFAFVVNACVSIPRCVGIVSVIVCFRDVTVGSCLTRQIKTTWGITDLYSWIPGTFAGQGFGLLWDGKYLFAFREHTSNLSTLHS